jgi:hypothetical protein
MEGRRSTGKTWSQGFETQTRSREPDGDLGLEGEADGWN